ncbi:hypothetical protein Taro_049658, partial [Colocasia esculenta]|nr:hypothetical protein [Colocasia esculenta]
MSSSTPPSLLLPLIVLHRGLLPRLRRYCLTFVAVGVVVSWSPQFLGLCLVERQLDLSSVAARLRGGPVRESRRPHTRRLALSRAVVAEGLHHRQCNFLTVVHLEV